MSKGNRRGRLRRRRQAAQKNKYGVRVRGGVRYLPEEDKFVLVIALWYSQEGLGEPDKEWYSDERFDDEETALDQYKIQIRPILHEWKSTTTDKMKLGDVLFHKEDDI